MNYDEEDYRKMQNLYDECENLMNYHVVLTTKDGKKYDGIIEKVEPDCVIMLTGEDVMEDDDAKSMSNMNRQYPRGRRFRRFRGRPYPYNNLLGVSVIPYPYYVPPYPFYPF